MTDVTVRKTERLKGEICAPPSKAYTQRMTIAAALATGTSKISNPLSSDDTESTLRAVTSLGAKVNSTKDCLIVEGAQPLRGSQAAIDCGESGATLRFMIPVAALASGPSIFLLGKSLEQRPMEPLLKSLKQLGAEVNFQRQAKKTFIVVQGGGIPGGKTIIRGDVSSQFISGLMFACPLARAETQIEVNPPLESKGYVKMTQTVLAEHDVEVIISENYDRLKIPPNQKYKPCNHTIPGDFSSSAFLLAAAAITHSQVSIQNLDFERVQGDKAILDILKRMGVQGKICSQSVEIEGKGSLLKAVDVDARNIPDLVPVCAVLACYAKGTSKIHDAHRLRYKESNRLLTLHLELKKMGAHISMEEDNLTIEGPSPLHGAVIDTHNDHRIAMACAIAALGASGETRIQDAECVRKSYPHFFSDLRLLGVNVVGGEFDR
jgi:3-phosphoshikimate 1-carboxyvinyltransferase